MFREKWSNLLGHVFADNNAWKKHESLRKYILIVINSNLIQLWEKWGIMRKIQEEKRNYIQIQGFILLNYMVVETYIIILLNIELFHFTNNKMRRKKNKSRFYFPTNK